MTAPIKTHLLIIGAGPVGLFSIFMAGMVGLSSCVLEAEQGLGGQCQSLYPEKPIYDIPGFKSVLAKDLIAHLWEQAQVFQPKMFFNHQAQTLRQGENGRWHVTTQQGQEFDAGAILLCVGHGAFSPIRPCLAGLDAFEQTGHVVYQVADPHVFKGKKVVIAGGGDSAVDWAIILSSIASHTHIMHRREEFRAQSHTLGQLQDLVNAGKVSLHAPCFLNGLQGQKELTHVSIEKEGDVHHLEADYFLPFFGIQPSLGPLLDWNFCLDKGRIVIDPTTGQTERAGLYAAGDGVAYPHKLKLILTGFAEAAQALHHIKGYLFPEKKFSFQHSTSTGITTDLL